MSREPDKNTQKLSSMFNLKADMASFDEIENTIVSGAKLHGTNAWILMMAILVASVGLNTNATAVIIGAMLISPLMGSIIAIAYGIATNNLPLARFSAARLTIQVMISVATSFVYFSLSPINAASSELLARTSPTIYDVLIATGGGFAGIVGLTRKEKGNVIPGVAIATALMPPLCTAGYGLAHKNWGFFSGALYLFFINGFFICLSAVIVLKYLRVPQFRELDKKQLTKIHRIIGLVAVITTLPSIYFAYNQIKDGIENNNAENYINNEFVFSGTQIMHKNIDTIENTIEISLIGKELTDDDIQLLKDKLEDYRLDGYKLDITQTTVESGITADEVKALLAEYEISDDNNDAYEFIAEKEKLTDEVERLREENAKLSEKIRSDEAEKTDIGQLTAEMHVINSKITGAAAADAEVYISENDHGSRTVVTLFVSQKLDNTEETLIKEWLETRLGKQDITLLQQVNEEKSPAKEEKNSSKEDSSNIKKAPDKQEKNN